MPDRFPAEDRVAVGARRDELFASLRELVSRHSPERAERLVPESFGEVDDARLANLLAQTLGFDVVERQQILETCDVRRRYELLCDLVQFKLAMQGAVGPSGAGQVH